LIWFSTIEDAEKVAVTLRSRASGAFYHHGDHDAYDGSFPVEYEAIELPDYADQPTDPDDYIDRITALNTDSWSAASAIDEEQVQLTKDSNARILGSDNYQGAIDDFTDFCRGAYTLLRPFTEDHIRVSMLRPNKYHALDQLTLEYYPYQGIEKSYYNQPASYWVYEYDRDKNTLVLAQRKDDDPVEYGNSCVCNQTDNRCLRFVRTLEDMRDIDDEDIVFIGSVDRDGQLHKNDAIDDVYRLPDKRYGYTPEDFLEVSMMAADLQDITRRIHQKLQS
jgi:hypothetical protein